MTLTDSPSPARDQDSQPDVSRSKVREKEVITQSIEAWVERVKESRMSLLAVQLGQKGEPCLAYTYLERELGCQGSVFKPRAKLLDTVLQRMIEEKIVILGHPSIANEWRRRLLFWYEGLSESEKKEIPIYAQSISTKASLFDVKALQNLRWARKKYPLVDQTYNELIADLTKIGTINPDYKTKTERLAEYESKKLDSPAKVSLRKAFHSLKAIPVNSYEDLVAQDPATPFKPLLHIFSAASKNVKNANFSEGYRFTVEHLKKTGFTGNEKVSEYFRANYLTSFRKFLSDKIQDGSLSTHTANSLLSAVRVTYKRATKIKGLGLTTFIDIEGFKKHRQTDLYRPYPPAVRNQIKQACDNERLKFNKLAKDYIPFGGGCDPVDSNGELKKGFVTLDNARWIFENKLKCRIIGPGSADLSNPYEKGFIRILTYVGLGLVETYESWGIFYQITSRHIAPYITRLAQVTGLNADSLKLLNVNDFVERHELTQRPYLRYWKERSDGEKNLHLDLVDADLTWLTLNQSKEVKEIFAETTYLTRTIRERAEGATRDKLFIYDSRKRNEKGIIKSFENSTVTNIMMNQLARDHLIKDEDGKPLHISPSRLRPSLVAELIEQGVSLREIQIILGHKHLSTTIEYLDQLDFNKTARDVLEIALAKIHKEAVANGSPKNEAPRNYEQIITTDAATAISTGLVKCRNVYDPPEDIKKLPTYKKGSACSLLNKCLSCSNSIVTASHLPQLFALRYEYQSMLETSAIGETPYGAIIKQNMEVLNSILTPSDQGFTSEQLEEAERLSEYIITSPLIEGVTL